MDGGGHGVFFVFKGCFSPAMESAVRLNLHKDEVSSESIADKGLDGTDLHRVNSFPIVMKNEETP